MIICYKCVYSMMLCGVLILYSLFESTSALCIQLRSSCALVTLTEIVESWVGKPVLLQLNN